ncbi:MAG: hypothetical protein ACTHMS_13225 [Jatrophihabitans sp.]|uniref:hypothetical protein n=1 Tax=Jatrophihabitans sp. TaxID=1932789 RepID=UPI003F811D06
MSTNAGWPLIEESVSFLQGPGSQLLANYVLTSAGYAGNSVEHAPAEAALWCNLTARTEGSWSAQRGRQYELDQVQTGTAGTTWRNDDGALAPNNPSSPFYPAVTLLRGYRRRAMYPVTKNLLTASQAQPSSDGWGFAWPKWATPNPAYYLQGAAYAIQSSFGNGLPTSIPAGTTLVAYGGFAITPGLAYSASVAVVGITNGLGVAVRLNWYGPGGTILSSVTGSTVTTVTRATVSGTAPSNCVGATMSVVVVTPPTATADLQLQQYQLEQAAVPTTFDYPGTWYDMFTGYVERWPQAWEDGGLYGTTTPQLIDAFGYLSQRAIRSPGYQEILYHGAAWFYPLDEPTGATQWNDLTGNESALQRRIVNGAPASQIVPGVTLPASSTSGVSSAVIYKASGFNPGAVSGPCTQFSNSPGSSALALLDLGAAKGSAGPSNATGWTMVFLVNTAASSASNPDQYVWAVYDPNNTSSYIRLAATGANFYQVQIDNGTARTLNIGSPTAFAGYAATDGCWHAIVLTMSADGKTLTGQVDNYPAQTLVTGSDMRPSFSAAAVETLGGSGNGSGGWSGYLSCVAYIATAIPTTTLFPTPGENEVYDGFEVPAINTLMATLTIDSSGSSEATSGTRFADILRWAGWGGYRSIDSLPTLGQGYGGQTWDYGPPIEFLAAAADTGHDAVSSLQTVTDTENGQQYVDRSGVVTFKNRSRRYGQTTPVATFGENTAAGEIPYEGAAFDFDPTLVADDVLLTQLTSGLAFRQVNPTSIASFGDVQLQRQVNTLDQNEILAAVSYLLQHEGTPQLRCEAITINVAAYPSCWQTMLGLELGSPVRINRRPSNAPQITFDGFVENIAWSMDDQGNASVTLQCSPNLALDKGAGFFDTARFQINPGDSTLQSAVTAAATSLVIATAAGAPPLTNDGTQYPFTIVIDSEQITLGAAPGSATSPQTFSTITRGANGTTASAHSAGAQVALATTALFAY